MLSAKRRSLKTVPATINSAESGEVPQAEGELADDAAPGEQPVVDEPVVDVVDGAVDSDTNAEPEQREEAPARRHPVIPVKPVSRAEIEDHKKTHWPYRSWCNCCNEGRGLGEQRGKHIGGSHEIHCRP